MMVRYDRMLGEWESGRAGKRETVLSTKGYQLSTAPERIQTMKNRRQPVSMAGTSIALLVVALVVLWGPTLTHAQSSHMVFGDERLLWKAGLLGDFQTTVLPLPPELGYVQVDDATGKIYFIEIVGRFIRRMNLDGTQVEVLLGPQQMDQLGIGSLGISPADNSIDTVAGKVYWLKREYIPGSTQILMSTLSIMNLDGTGLSQILRMDNLAMLQLLVDEIGHRLYWVEEVPGGPTYAIRSSALDGSDVKSHVTGIQTSVAGLDVDNTGQQLLWTTVAQPSGADAALWQSPVVGPPVDVSAGAPTLTLGRNSPGRPVTDEASRVIYVMTREPLRNINRTVPVLKRVDLLALPLALETIRQTSSFDFHYSALSPVQGAFYWSESEDLTTDEQVGILWATSLDGISDPTPVTKNAIPAPGGIGFDKTDGKVYWALPDVGAIRQSTLDGSPPFVDILNGLNQPKDVAVDPVGQKIYWSEPVDGTIKRANLDGTGTEVFMGGLLGLVGRLDLDLADRTLYWTDYRAIKAIKTDGTGRRSLVEGTSSTQQPLDIAVDSANRQIYWTEPATGVIKRSNLDGTRVRPILDGLINPRGIAVDPAAGRIYWTSEHPEGLTGLIRSATTDGADIETVIKDLNLSVNTIHLALTEVPSISPFPTGDVSGDFKVDAFDAALILQFSVGLINSFPADDLLGTAPGQDLALHYEVGLPRLTARSGDRIIVPVSINQASGYQAGAVTLNYDPRVLRAHQVHMSLNGTYWKANTQTQGEVRMAFAAFEDVQSDGDLFVVEFDVLPRTTGIESSLVLDYVALSNSLSVQKANGMLTVAPTASALLQNYPNPFNPETWIPYHLSERTDVSIQIFDLQGQRVRSLDLGAQPAGVYVSRERAAYWNGRNSLNEPIASGTYFYVLHAGDYTDTRKMIVLR